MDTGTAPEVGTPNKKRKTSDETSYSEVVYILVGFEEVKFKVHLAVITKASPFFQRVLEEAKAKVNIESQPDMTADHFITFKDGCYFLHLPNEDPDIFKYVNAWFYFRRLTEPDAEVQANDLSWITLIDIYYFAVNREMPGLQNAIVKAGGAKYSRFNVVPDFKQINSLYEKDENNITMLAKAKTAPFRSMFVDMFAAKEGVNVKLSFLERLHPLFLAALVMKFYALKDEKMEEIEALKQEVRARQRGKGKGRKTADEDGREES